MRIDELYSKLSSLDFVESFYISSKHVDEESEQTERVLKIYDADAKLAEISVDSPYMLRTTYPAFARHSLLEQQALLQILVNFATTPVDQRQSAQYFAYYSDLNGITHFIKRLSNNRLTDELIPMAYFKTLDEESLNSYLFTMAEFENFPENFRPTLKPDSFVKVISYEDMMNQINELYSGHTTSSDDDDQN